MDAKNYEIKDFTRIKFEASVPDLLDIQLSSWIDFLQEDVLPEKRDNNGLEAVFKNIFPIEDNHKKFAFETQPDTINKHKDLNYEAGCEWLGTEYYNSIGKKAFTKETVLQGILEEQKIWNPPS